MKRKLIELLPILLLTLIFLVVFLPILTGGVYLISGVSQNDQWLFNYPLKEFYRTQLLQGKLPLWTNLIGNGYPIFAEGQVGALYPLHLLLFRLLPTTLAYNANIFIHFVMTAVFTYLFARNINLSKKASFLSAIVYSLSGFMTIHIHQININMVITYLPLALLAVDRMVSKRYVWFGVLTTVFTLQILAGHIEMFYYCIGITGVYFLIRLFLFGGDKTNRTYIVLTTALFTLSVLFAFGISFIQIAATYELNKFSQRSEGLSIEHASATLWPLETLGMFINPRQYELYRVEKDYTPTGETVNVQALYGYIGIIPLLLAISAIALSRKKTTIIFASIMFIAFFYGLGRSTQLFAIFWHLVPGLKFFRFPTKILFLIEFCLAVLAGIGFESITTRFKIYDRRFKMGYFLIVISLADLLYFNAFGTRKIIDGRKWLEAPESARTLSEKIGDPYTERVYTHGMSNIDYAYATNREYQMVFRNMLPIDFNMIYKIPTNQEWAVLFLERQSVMNSERAKVDFENGTISLTLLHKKALALQAVRYIISDVEIMDPDLVEIKMIPFPAPVDHIFYVGAGEGTSKVQLPVDGVHIYENKYFYPRVGFVRDAEVVDSAGEAFEKIMEEGFNPQEEVVVEALNGNRGIENGKNMTNRTNMTYKAYIEKDGQDEVEIAVEAEDEGILVLSDTYYPGWRAYVDGREEEIFRANYAFRGVRVGEGKYTVIMKYEPTYWKVGKIISLGCLGLFGIVWVGMGGRGILGYFDTRILGEKNNENSPSTEVRGIHKDCLRREFTLLSSFIPDGRASGYSELHNKQKSK